MTLKRTRRFEVKTLLVFAALILAVGISPLATYAQGHDQQKQQQARNGHDQQGQQYAQNRHDQHWKQQHATEWKSHSKQWAEYDRQWQAHRTDTRWQKEHAKMWHDWYQWHKDGGEESGLGIHLSFNF